MPDLYELAQDFVLERCFPAIKKMTRKDSPTSATGATTATIANYDESLFLDVIECAIGNHEQVSYI